MLKASKKDPIIFEKAIQSHWDHKIFYLRLQPAASITCLGLPTADCISSVFDKKNVHTQRYVKYINKALRTFYALE